jgi:hypothetical protein
LPFLFLVYLCHSAFLRSERFGVNTVSLPGSS